MNPALISLLLEGLSSLGGSKNGNPSDLFAAAKELLLAQQTINSRQDEELMLLRVETSRMAQEINGLKKSIGLMVKARGLTGE